MDVLLRMTLSLLNFGLALGLIFAGMLLLRPLLVRVLSPQQRALVWTLGWMMGIWPSFMSMALLPVTFLDLVTPRVSLTQQTPSYLTVVRAAGLDAVAAAGGDGCRRGGDACLLYPPDPGPPARRGPGLGAGR